MIFFASFPTAVNQSSDIPTDCSLHVLFGPQVEVISKLEYAAGYLASESITKHNILANAHRAKGHEQKLSLELLRDQ